MAHSENAFKEALAGKEIPLLTLDNKWHQLFTQAQTEIPAEVQRGEVKLNELIKRQGKLNTESKDIRKVKKKLMTEIMEMADLSGGNPDAATEKKMEDNRRLINECNEKMDAYEEEMVELPRQINQLNNKLMLITMEVCYKKLQQNTAELEEIEQWIGEIRRELKKKVVRKQEKEAMNHRLYAYMHDIFGADVIELFDMKYNPEEKYQKKAQEKEQTGQAEEDKPKEDNTDASKS